MVQLCLLWISSQEARPCQGVSIAGARKGLADERSGLFIEQIRIIKEMRNADVLRGRTAEFLRPRYMVWENVPGVFSSNGYKDFQAVLEETIRIVDDRLSVPRPPNGKWKSAGCILGDKFSLAWRILDTQHWPKTPQRRKRIYLILDTYGFSAPKVLFEQDSLFGNTQESQGERESVATTTGKSIEDTSRTGLEEYIVLSDQGGERMDVSENVVGTLRASMGGNVPIVMGSSQPNAEICENISPTITASSGGGGNSTPLLFENHSIDSRYTGPLEVAPTIAAQMGTGGNNGSIILNEKTESYCIASNTINRKDKNEGNGIGVQKDISYTLTTNDIHCIYSEQENQKMDLSSCLPYQNVVGALMHRDHKGVNTCYVNQDKCIVQPYQKTVGALCSGDWKGPGNQYVSQDKCIVNRNLVRRLTPLECELLMGYEPNWTNIEGASDSPRYKALGNSVAIPCVNYVMRGIAYFLNKENLESEVK